MSEHYTQGTDYVLEFSPTCMKTTEHAVSNGRRGRCKEHGPRGETQRQTRARLEKQRAQQQPKLF